MESVGGFRGTLLLIPKIYFLSSSNRINGSSDGIKIM